MIKQRTILDLGCGSNKYPGALGIDVSATPNVDVIGDVLIILKTWPDESVDMVVMRQFLEHVDAEQLFREVHRVCKSNAKVLVEVPNPLYFFVILRALLKKEAAPWSGVSPHIHCFSRPELRNLFSKTGFHILELTNYTEWESKGGVKVKVKRAVMRFASLMFPFFSRDLRCVAVKN